MTRTTPPDTRIIPADGSEEQNWKRSTYMLGAALGTVLGLLSAYFYARAADEDATRSGSKPRSIPTKQVLSLSLAVLGLIRQIAEMGKPPKK